MINNTPRALHSVQTPTTQPPHGANQQQALDRILRKKELTELLGVSVATVYRWIKTENLPKPLKLGANAVGWKLSEINAWLESRERAEIGEVA